MTVQERLKLVRDAQKKTQKEMAVLLGISPRTWQDYEGGVNVPGFKVLEGLSRLGFNVDWILTGVREMNRSPVRLTETEAHQALKSRIKDNYDQIFGLILQSNEMNGSKFQNYVNGDYLPTKKELDTLCKAAGGWDFETATLVTHVEKAMRFRGAISQTSERMVPDDEKANQQFFSNYSDVDEDTTELIDRLLNEKSCTYGELTGGKAIIIATTIYRIYSRNFVENPAFRRESLEKIIDVFFRLAVPAKESSSD